MVDVVTIESKKAEAIDQGHSWKDKMCSSTLLMGPWDHCTLLYDLLQATMFGQDIECRIIDRILVRGMLIE